MYYCTGAPTVKHPGRSSASYQLRFPQWLANELLLLDHSQDVIATTVPIFLIKYDVPVPQPQAFILLMDVGMLIETVENGTHSEN